MIPEGLALVCLVAGAATEQIGGSFYLAGDTCLNQLARLARLFPPWMQLHVFYEHSEAKWSGRGQLVEVLCGAAAKTRLQSAKKSATKKRQRLR